MYPAEITALIVQPTGNLGTTTPTLRQREDLNRLAFLSIQAKIDGAANLQTGTAYTLVLTDAVARVERSNASANTTTVPPNSSVAWPANCQIDILQVGAGVTTVVAGAGVTINSRGGLLACAGQWALATLVWRATDTWLLIGDIA